jgi:NADH:ubiquinone oxidoreductase subunit 6 (subunit J)
MNFFKKTWVMILAFVFIAIGTLILFLNGKTEGEVATYVGLVFAAIGAVVMIIKFIIDQVTKAKQTSQK